MPRHPGAQLHWPDSGSQVAPFLQLQVYLQSLPYMPCSHGWLHSSPSQPGLQRQVPSSGSQWASLRHLQTRWQPWP